MASLQDAVFFCIPSEKLPHHQRLIYCSLCIASSSLGFCGSIWQIARWRPVLKGYQFRRKPSPNPLVILSLAAADLLACLGVLCRALLMLVTPAPVLVTNVDPVRWKPGFDNPILKGFGYVIEAWTQYFYGVTFMWTVLYAIDIYIQLSYKNPSYLKYILSAWSIPGLVTVGSLLAVIIHDDFPASCASGVNLIVHYSFYYLFIIIVIIANPVFFFLTGRLITQRVKESGIVSSQNKAVMSAIQKKFLAVVIIFTICWLPNVIDSVMHIIVAAKHIPPEDTVAYFPLWAIEAFLNPLQGLLNCFIYNRHVLFQYGRPPNMNTPLEDQQDETTPFLYKSRATYTGTRL